MFKIIYILKHIIIKQQIINITFQQIKITKLYSFTSTFPYHLNKQHI